jgi:hypothetical protein
MLFGNYQALLFLRQVPSPRLAFKAEEIATYLGLPLEIVDVGLGELEERLAELVEGGPPSQLNAPSGALRHLPGERGGPLG